MKPAAEFSTLDLPIFLRMFQMRKAQIMWFLGAGASRAAGIKTASDMIWEFKRNLYCSEKKQPLSVVSDLGEPAPVDQQLEAVELELSVVGVDPVGLLGAGEEAVACRKFAPSR